MESERKLEFVVSNELLRAWGIFSFIFLVCEHSGLEMFVRDFVEYSLWETETMMVKNIFCFYLFLLYL